MSATRKIRFNERIQRSIRDDGAVLDKNGKVWKYGHNDRDGYKIIQIDKKIYRIHRLVAETFIPNPENKPTVDHINRIKDDNRVENLRWATTVEQNTNRVFPIGRLGIRTEDRSEYNRTIYHEYKSTGRCW